MIECKNKGCFWLDEENKICTTKPKLDSAWFKNKAIVYCRTHKYRDPYLEKMR